MTTSAPAKRGEKLRTAIKGRYAPAYKAAYNIRMFGVLLGLIGIVIGLGGVVLGLTAISEGSSDGGIILLGGMFIFVVLLLAAFLLVVASSFLRAFMDRSVFLVPGLTDDEKLQTVFEFTGIAESKASVSGSGQSRPWWHAEPIPPSSDKPDDTP